MVVSNTLDMDFWNQFWPDFAGGVASGLFLAALGFASRHKIIRSVKRSIKRIEEGDSQVPPVK